MPCDMCHNPLSPGVLSSDSCGWESAVGMQNSQTTTSGQHYKKMAKIKNQENSSLVIKYKY